MWAVSKALRYPLDVKLKDMNYMPYTISYVLRKRMQVDSYNELPKEKRPPEKLIWDGTSKEIDEWFDTVFENTKKKANKSINDGIVIDLDLVE